MKIQCDSCSKAEAEVLCYADEAVLCLVCDEVVHAANKLSSTHQRVLLVKHPPCNRANQSSSCNGTDQSPSCDICQEKKGYIFCLEDRVLLCRNCDMDMHNVNPYTSIHRRYLIAEVRVGLNTSSSSSSPALGQVQQREVQQREDTEAVLVNRDMNSATVSFTDTPAEFSYLQSNTTTDRLTEQWPAVQDILDNNLFDYSYDFSDLRYF